MLMDMGNKHKTDVLTEFMVMTASKGYVLPCNFFLHEEVIHVILQLKVVFEQAFTNHLQSCTS